MKLICAGLVVILLAYICLAEAQTEPKDNITLEAGVAANTSPDSFSYKVHNFWDQLSYTFTWDKAAKAQKGLQIARKHLWEVNVYSEKKDLDKAQKAQDEYGKWISKVKDNAENLRSDDPKVELEQNVKISAELQKDDALLNDVKSNVEASPKLSKDEKEKMGSILTEAEKKKEEVKRSVEDRREKVGTKYKARFGLKEDDLKEEVKKLEVKTKNEEEKDKKVSKEKSNEKPDKKGKKKGEG